MERVFIIKLKKSLIFFLQYLGFQSLQEHKGNQKRSASWLPFGSRGHHGEERWDDQLTKRSFGSFAPLLPPIINPSYSRKITIIMLCIVISPMIPTCQSFILSIFHLNITWWGLPDIRVTCRSHHHNYDKNISTRSFHFLLSSLPGKRESKKRL